MKKSAAEQPATDIHQEPLAIAAKKINLKTRRRVSRLREQIQRLNKTLDDGTAFSEGKAK
jgi:hypothetical protein